MRKQDWTFFASLFAAVAAVQALVQGFVGGALGWGLVAVAATLAGRYWSRHEPGPMPHALAWFLALPHPFHSPARLRDLLDPRPGECILEIGPGTGYHALPVAGWLGPTGRLVVLDVQRPMLTDLRAKAARQGVENVTAVQGSGERLPYPDARFDAAYLMTVLGEIPDPTAALREIRRVLRPAGRLVVGEMFFDPDWVGLGALRTEAAAAGFRLETTAGPSLAYLARLVPA